MYYRGASAAMLVYDITNAKSLAETREWVNELRANTDHDTRELCCPRRDSRLRPFLRCFNPFSALFSFPNPLPVICLLANKCDQLKESDEELIGKGRDFADSIGALFYKTSAQANEGASGGIKETGARRCFSHEDPDGLLLSFSVSGGIKERGLVGDLAMRIVMACH